MAIVRMTRFWGAGLLLSLLTACASKPEDDSVAKSEAVLLTTGLITFSEGADDGLVVNRIDWNQPLSSENPGVDCPLRLRKDEGAQAVHSCVVKGAAEAPIVVTIQQNIVGSSTQLAKILIDAKGEKTATRWAADLTAAGYKEKPGSKKPGWRYFSSVTTDAALVWVAAKDAVTIILTPKR